MKAEKGGNVNCKIFAENAPKTECAGLAQFSGIRRNENELKD